MRQGRNETCSFHFNGKVSVGYVESEEVWLEKVKKQLMEAWIIDFYYLSVSEFWSNLENSLALGDGWVGNTLLDAIIAPFKILYKNKHFYRVSLVFLPLGNL